MFVGDFSLTQWVANALPDAVLEVADGCLLEGYGSNSYNGQQEPIRSNTRIELLVSILQVGLLCPRESPIVASGPNLKSPFCLLSIDVGLT
uniref:Uncharacterized protein n=1 Tax=Nymphaea colorata TaxID=210225 RepID=A0A5K1CAL9_9MAGN